MVPAGLRLIEASRALLAARAARAGASLEAFRLEGGRWVDAGRLDGTSVARIAPFEAIELDEGRLFPPTPPPAG